MGWIVVAARSALVSYIYLISLSTHRAICITSALSLLFLADAYDVAGVECVGTT